MSKEITWSDGWLLGISEIDLQHKKLFDIFNELYALASKPTEDYKLDMSRIMKKLTDYTVYHFDSEEQLMKRHKYADLATHEEQHKSFVAEVFDQIKRLSDDNPADSLELYSFLMDWLVNHIGKSDAQWAQHMLKK